MGSGRPGSVGPGRLEGRASELRWRGAGVGVGLERRAFVGDGGGGLASVWTFATESDCRVGPGVWDCRVNAAGCGLWVAVLYEAAWGPGLQDHVCAVVSVSKVLIIITGPSSRRASVLFEDL